MRLVALAPPAMGVLGVLIRPVSAALEPSEIALIVNDQVPQSRELAAHYAAERHIPDGRIISVSIDEASKDNPGEDIAFADYEPRVAEPVRRFLRANALESKVHCLITFWGIPLRIGGHVSTPLENEEIGTIQAELKKARPRLEEQVVAAETLAQRMQPTFKPTTQAAEPENLGRRAEAASQIVLTGLTQDPDPTHRATVCTQFLGFLEQLIGADPTLLRMSALPLSQVVPAPVTPDQLNGARERLGAAQVQLSATVSTPAQRLAQRHAATQLGLLGRVGVLNAQLARLDVKESESALDSELSLLWWNGNYQRSRWLPNALNWRFSNASPQQMLQLPGPVLMVSRLDGASPEVVRGLIDTSIRTEKQGLGGQLAIDARGKPPKDPYGNFDESLRNLAAIARAKASLKVTLDDQEQVFPPGSVPDVGLYCGWYSLRNYVPGCKFVPGAVGYHVASFELISLRAPNEHGWVRGLMGDGVVATLGPVAEPYLHSFPRADEFFPLLMTGQLTFAEVYWRTNPLASWMQACIGDPLYNPYRAKPAMSVSDLPRPLELALRLPAATTRPVPPDTARLLTETSTFSMIG